MKKGNGVTRKYAEKVLLEIPKIADSINKDAKHFQLITKIAVYGSYISTNKEILGDLDLAVEVKNKYEENEHSSKLFQLINSFNSGSYIERLFKANDYVYKCLVNGKKCLHINPYNVLEISGLSEDIDYKIIYDFDN
ncbi:hypothetical protein [Desnuesiella massiliensis]|uniref:hypothetical protein n=1 Tax=Desnuesiella massiliensis TaxID=1650662 RepID=UPI0006E1DF58|nr:hypothetical protein [Desnuesiella massiliensis]